MKSHRAFSTVVTSCVLALALSCGTPATAARTTDYSDLWFVPTESGWGIQLVQQSLTIFATMFVYGPDGQPTWYTATLNYQGAGTFAWNGDLIKTTGPWFGSASFDSTAVTRTVVGSMTFSGSTTDLHLGTLTYTVNGVQVVKQIQRQLLVYENFSGTYTGVISQQGTGAMCNPADNTSGMPVTVQINQNATAMTIVTNMNGNTCTFPGTYSQRGHFGSINGSYVCTSGDAGTFLIFEMADSQYDFRARIRFVSQTGCTLAGQMDGIRPYAPPTATPDPTR